MTIILEMGQSNPFLNGIERFERHFSNIVDQIMEPVREVSYWCTKIRNFGSLKIRNDGSAPNIHLFFFWPDSDFRGDTEELDAVLLADVVENIVASQGDVNTNPGTAAAATATTKLSAPIPIVVKIDIEHFECRAFLGSPWIFEDSRIFMPYIMMEWTYMTRKVNWREESIVKCHLAKSV